MSKLFTPVAIGGKPLANRIVVPPMCQYSATNGLAGDWHLMHYGQLSHSGAGLMILEASAVVPEGRLSPFDLGMWGDEQEAAMKRLVSAIRVYSDMPLGIQLVHAGRKASMPRPWEQETYITPEKGGWKTVAPSALAYNEHYDTPEALTETAVTELTSRFVDAAVRAVRAGIDMIELHAAHGYLMHQFLSPLSNTRTDNYGGSLDNRMRFVLNTFQAVRAALPAEVPVGIRISATDWVEGGWNLDESVVLAEKLDALGCSFIHVSTAGLDPRQQIPVGPDYQVPCAARIKAAVSMPVIAVGLITEPVQAEAVVGTGQADLVAIGRDMLFNPHWAWHAAEVLGAQVRVPPQYLRSAHHGAKDLFAK